MVTVREHASVQAIESSLHSRSGAATPVSDLEKFLDFMAQASPQATRPGAQEPPVKKRRLSKEQSLSTIVDSSALDSNQIPLIRIVVPLGLPDLDVLDQTAWIAIVRGAVPVSLRAAESHSAHQLSLSLAVCEKFEENIHMRLTSPGAQRLLSHLERIPALQTRAAKSSRSKPIVTAQCTIHPPGLRRQTFELEAVIYWTSEVSIIESSVAPSAIKRAEIEADLELLAKYLPNRHAQDAATWSVQDFYENVHVPATDAEVSPRIQTELMESKMYPFQKRAVDWLLRREGEKTLLEKLESASFNPATDADDRDCYVSHLHGMVLTPETASLYAPPDLRGGILAEEMGLGKTVELIALMCLHTRPPGPPQLESFDVYSDAWVTNSPGTLIVTPPSLIEQWKSEINNHAPHLKVFVYTGLPSVNASQKRIKELSVQNLVRYDVVLTTYSILSREIHYAKAHPQRTLRHEKAYEPRKSPLVEISWWRVCLDEAQMVESGVSQAATVARLIPRCNAWAVSGTPLRKDVQDLLGLLIFLRYEPYCSSKRIWSRINKGLFKEIFGEIALRHSKAKIRHELQLPPQKRVVITVPFTAVEEQNYNHLLQQMCDDLQLKLDGSPASNDWDPTDPLTIQKMRRWLVRLRQTCLHPQVGGRNRKALGRGNAPLRTVAEVLEIMIEQNGTVLRTEEREQVLAQVLRGHIVANAKDDERRSEKALDIYVDGLRLANSMVKDCRQELALEEDKSAALGSGLHSVNESADENTDAEEHTADQAGRVAIARKALRSALEVQHICLFFTATCYYQISSNEQLTNPESEEFHGLQTLEAEYYERAKVVRKELLQEVNARTERRMRKIDSKSQARSFAHVKEVKPLKDLGGIENRKVLEKMDEVGATLNAQIRPLNEWRNKVVKLLLSPLVDREQSQETTGDEYEDSTKAQDELFVYVTALRAIVADRQCAITGQPNPLIDHEMKVGQQQASEGDGHAPELFLKIMEVRDKLKPSRDEASLRSVLAEARGMHGALQWQKDAGSGRAAAEAAVVESHLKEIQHIVTEQTKIVAALDKELNMFTMAMNERVEFYRQLQHISDTVAPYKEELDERLDHEAVHRQLLIEEWRAGNVARLRTKRRFLLHLRDESQSEESARICIICQSGFELGVLTVCGHQYCKECIRLWWNEHRTCPICKRRLHKEDFHDITYKPKELRAHEEQHEPSSPDRRPISPSAASSISLYADISSSTLNEIKAIDLTGSYGTKIDSIARHVIWLRQHDPGCKSIIFSQFSDFLEVLGRAFKEFKIGCTSISDKGGIETFKRDPHAECFLLDARTDSSGLNLVNATYVFLCEPLINPAIELQAIARVHRIGQQRQTTVFMYLTSDTVEEAIYDISVSRRLAHIARRPEHQSQPSSGAATPALQENAIDAANSLEMQQAPLSKLLVQKKGGGEIVENEDLWQCLFSRARVQRAGPSRELEMEVGRHLRAEAAEGREESSGLRVTFRRNDR
ncbi:hypothetical protein H2199_003124 [Coniosporium tulheliwenetii]|uniref:Uncharacterized protein n=1 Tax=Coniosporium tulheliwenetii TaxID=3383036 RepID=A0ACC2ZC06_9PEZI|nr:hypothetical protein H2199_003124 [Cladosporium sp. JES 115]